MKFSPVSLIVLSFAVVASAAPSFRGRGTPVVDRSVSDSLDTNAKRLAAGLPPLPARKLWSPTDSAKRWNNSPVPRVGKVGIKSANGTHLGFVSRVLNVNGSYTLDLNETNAASIFFASPKFATGHRLSLKDQTSNSTNATFFGAVIRRGFSLRPGNDTLPPLLKRDGTSPEANSTDSVSVAGVGQTAPDQGPQTVPTTVGGSSNSTGEGGSSGGGTGGSGNGGGSSEGSDSDGESAIWSYDPNTQQWNVTWINYDGSQVGAIPYFDPGAPGASSNASSIALVANVPSYLSTHPQAVEISLNFVE